MARRFISSPSAWPPLSGSGAWRSTSAMAIMPLSGSRNRPTPWRWPELRHCPNTDTASSNVTGYGAATGDENASSLFQNAQATPTFLCLNTVVKMGITCAASTGSTSGSFNAIRVVQTASVPLWFGGMFGVPTLHLTKVATAVMSGGSNTPWNIAIVLDTTASMASKDSGLQCSGTQISCALQGAQALLMDLFPCALGTTCTAQSGNPLMVNSPVDSVALFVFPAVTTATESKDYVCNTSNPTTIPYTFTNVNSGSSENLNPPTTATYEEIPFSSNYRTSDSASSLNSGSEIAIASGDSGKSGCGGIGAPGGEGTYYAQVVYQAQAALVAQQASYPGSQNAMIILSDGDATASASSGQIKATTGTLNGTGSGSNKYTYTYPSALGECGQAVVAAQAATTAGTRVYTVGYGSENSGCTTDATYSAYKRITPCEAIQDMASAPAYFYSDDADGCASPNGTNFTKLTQIFQAIAGNFTTPRLVPNGTT